MKQLAGLIILPLLLVARPGAAQDSAAGASLPAIPQHSLNFWPSSNSSDEPRPIGRQPVIALSDREHFNPDQSRTRRRGIVVSTDLGPNATVGVGLLKMQPRRSGLSVGEFNPPRPGGSKSAAVRFSLRF